MVLEGTYYLGVGTFCHESLQFPRFEHVVVPFEELLIALF